MQAAAEIARDNSIMLSQAGDLQSFKDAEIAVAERGAEEIIRRAGEIETELRARMAVGATTPPAPATPADVSAMEMDQLQKFVEGSSVQQIDALPEEEIGRAHV